MQITIDFQLENYRQTMAIYKSVITCPAGLLGAIGASVLRENQRRHDQGIAPDGTPWARLATSPVH